MTVWKTRGLRIAFAAIFACLASGAFAHKPITTKLTWAEDIRPIFRDKCMVCHHPGGAAPDIVDLTRYGDNLKPGVRGWSAAIKHEILTGEMPPWQADPRVGAFQNSRGLTEDEKNRIVAWIDGAAPEGPPFDVPAPEEFLTPTWRFGQPAIELRMAEPHTLAPGAMSGEAVVALPVDVAEDTWITAIEFMPGQPQIVHSIEAWLLDAPGAAPETLRMERKLPYDEFAVKDTVKVERTSTAGAHFLGRWTKGEPPTLMPDYAGRRLRKGSSIELRIQYTRPKYVEASKAIADRSALGLHVARNPKDIDRLVESKTAALSPDAGGGGSSPMSLEFTVQENTSLLGLHPRVNANAQNLRAEALFPDGLRKTLFWIPKYDAFREASYWMDSPIATPKGTRIVLTAETAPEPASPPTPSPRGTTPLSLTVDYMLDDHLISEPDPVAVALEPVSAEEQAANEALFLALSAVGGESVPTTIMGEKPWEGPGATPSPTPAPNPMVSIAGATPDVYWCPMRGNPCGLDDYAAGAKCKDCGMDVLPRVKFFEGKTSAPAKHDWQVSMLGAKPVYWCPNRGRDDHSLVDFSAPGACPICKETLLQQALFETVHTWTCVTPNCARKGDIFYGPGLCPDCGQPVTGMGHMDHTPVHGGWQFFMADNLYHHLEGTMPKPGEFRLYFYDDWKSPLDPRNFNARLIFEREGANGVVTEEETPMLAPDGAGYLVAKVPESLPLAFYAKVWLAGVEKRFDFEFDKLTVEPPAGQSAAAIRLHSHQRAPVAIPDTPRAIVDEILKRDATIAERMKFGDWFGLHNPAYDAKDLAAALALKKDGLDARQLGAIKKAVGAINRGANALDSAGDASDGPRAEKAYGAFAEGVKTLRETFSIVGAN